MSSTDAPPIRTHEDAALFREAVMFTTVQTGFESRLIEKDYFCSVVLQYLAAGVPGLVFKGGTGAILVSANTQDMARIARVFPFDFVAPSPKLR